MNVRNCKKVEADEGMILSCVYWVFVHTKWANIKSVCLFTTTCQNGYPIMHESTSFRKIPEVNVSLDLNC